MPRVSIVMPAYNAERYVEEAVRSILAQTLADFELIIIDDGSTDGTPAILDHVAADDSRIRLFHQANQRIVATLNRGFALAQGEYIARMDADDIALPRRLEKQVAMLDARRDIDLCGTWIDTFSVSAVGESVAGRAWHYPADPDFIPCFFLFWCCIAHPTVMLRARLFQQDGIRYDAAFNHGAEDYALWSYCAGRYRFANIPEVLLRYREHAAQGSRVREVQQRAATRTIREAMLRRIGLSPLEAQMDLHHKLSESELEPGMDFVRAAGAWLDAIRAANERSGALPRGPLAKVLGGRWAAVCLAAKGTDGVWEEFWRWPLAGEVDLGLEKNRGISRRDQTSV